MAFLGVGCLPLLFRWMTSEFEDRWKIEAIETLQLISGYYLGIRMFLGYRKPLKTQSSLTQNTAACDAQVSSANPLFRTRALNALILT